MKAVNLLPSDLRGAAKGASTAVISEPEGPNSNAPFMVLGALALCVAAVAGYVLTGNTVKQRQSDLAQVSARQQVAAAQAAKLKPYADFASLAQSRAQTVRDLASSRFDWEQAIRDVSRAVPAAVTLSELDGTVSSETGAGGNNALRPAISAPALELKGCTTGQTAVAQLMSRLRDVEGVTRVTLSKSDKGALPQPSTGPTAAGSAAQTPCGTKHSPPSFEVVIFFERSSVPATVKDVTVAAATPASAAGAATAAAGTALAAASASADGQNGPSAPASASAGGAASTPASTTTTQGTTP